MLCKDKFRPLIAASRRQETKRRFAVMCSSHSLTLIHTHIPARLHNMATNYIKQCLCLLFLSHGKFVRRLAFCCRISEAEPQNCHVNCKKNENYINSHHKLFIYSPTTNSTKYDYIPSILTERLASVCLSVCTTCWRCSVWTLWTPLTACLSQPSPKCYTQMKTI